MPPSIEAQIKSSPSTSSKRCCDFTNIFTGDEFCFPAPSWLTSCSSRSVAEVCVSSILRARAMALAMRAKRSEEHTSELQSLAYLVCRLLLEKKKKEPTFG